MLEYLEQDIIAAINRAELTKREIEVIFLRFNFDHKIKAYGVSSLQEIADYLKLAKERVRQLEMHAMKKIRLKSTEQEWLKYVYLISYEGYIDMARVLLEGFKYDRMKGNQPVDKEICE